MTTDTTPAKIDTDFDNTLPVGILQDAQQRGERLQDGIAIIAVYVEYDVAVKITKLISTVYVRRFELPIVTIPGRLEDLVMDKTQVLISNNWHSVGYPECAGCPNLIITHGACDFERFVSSDCEYPDKRVTIPPSPSDKEEA